MARGCFNSARAYTERMAIFVGDVVGGLAELRCPHCKQIQTRAKKPGGAHAQYRCGNCHRVFSRREGEQAMRPRERVARSRRAK